MTSMFATLKKPSIYTKSAAAFWDDDYISKQMLKAHLNPELDGASRKRDFIDQSVNWITGLLPPNLYPTLLDIGCGPGLYGEAFAKQGYQVTGIDFSKRSIAYAKQSAYRKHLKINYLYQDYLNMDLRQCFDMVTMIYCDFGALSPLDRQCVLQRIHTHLKLGGKLLLDVFSMKKFNDFQETQTWETIQKNGFWRAEEHVVLNGYYKYSNSVTLDLRAIFTEDDGTFYYLWNTYFSEESLTNEMKRCGFKVCKIYGDVAGNRNQPDHDTLAILVEKVQSQ